MLCVVENIWDKPELLFPKSKSLLIFKFELMKKLLFVCTGNICRSPTAHALARHHITELNLDHKITVDSAGTSSFHQGENPDDRALAVGERRGVSFKGIKSREIKREDFADFDLIFAMDNSHLRDLKRVSHPAHHHKIHLFLQYAQIKNSSNDEVKDPYYGGIDGFENVFNLIDCGVESIIKKI